MPQKHLVSECHVIDVIVVSVYKNSVCDISDHQLHALYVDHVLCS